MAGVINFKVVNNKKVYKCKVFYFFMKRREIRGYILKGMLAGAVIGVTLGALYGQYDMWANSDSSSLMKYLTWTDNALEPFTSAGRVYLKDIFCGGVSGTGVGGLIGLMKGLKK